MTGHQPQRIRSPERVGVRERNDVGLCLRDELVDDGCFALVTVEFHQADARVAFDPFADQRPRSVGGTIVAEQQLQVVGRVIKRLEIIDPLGDMGFLVVQRDQHRHRREMPVIRLRRAAAASYQRPEHV